MTDSPETKSPKQLEREREAARKVKALRDNLRRRKQVAKAAKSKP